MIFFQKEKKQKKEPIRTGSFVAKNLKKGDFPHYWKWNTEPFFGKPTVVRSEQIFVKVQKENKLLKNEKLVDISWVARVAY